jgi:cyanophycinase
MMAGGANDASHEDGDELRLSAGLGLLLGVIIDQHFAERGRIGRLLGAVAQNPRLLGIGIDEDTALMIEQGRYASVLGSGAVYMLDGREMTYTNYREGNSATMSAFGIRVHVLSESDRFDLESRVPGSGCHQHGAREAC